MWWGAWCSVVHDGCGVGSGDGVVEKKGKVEWRWDVEGGAGGCTG